MKTTVRPAVYETNSSSTHGFAYARLSHENFDIESVAQNIEDNKGTLTLGGDSYGWGPDVIENPLEKMEYLLTDQDDEETKMKILAAVKAVIPEVEDISFTKGDDDYVDHQSQGISRKIMDSENIMEIIQFIFDNNWKVVLSSDG